MAQALWRRQLCGTISLLLVLAASPARARDDQSAAGGDIDPQARIIVEDFGRFLTGLKGFGVRIRTQIQVGEKPVTIDGMQQLAVERPARLVFIGDPTVHRTVLRCDGNSVSTYFARHKQYVLQAAPKTCEGLVPTLRGLKLTHPAIGSVATSAILADDPAKMLLSNVTSLRYGGIVMLDGVRCHLIEAVGKELDWQMWIDAGDEPLVRQVMPDLKRLTPTAEWDGKMTSIVRFEWKVNPKFKPNLFDFKVPQGATEARTFEDVLGRPSDVQGADTDATTEVDQGNGAPAAGTGKQ